MHEILTVQVGREANYLATHFWNAQETYQTFAPEPPSSVNHDIHFRQGLTRDGTETYLPRTMIYDLKGGFGSLAKVNALEGAIDANAEREASVWNGPLTKLPSLPQPQISPYTHSLMTSSTPVAPTAATTPFFSDFAATFFHPRSLLPLAPPHPTLSASSAPATSPAPTPQFTSFAHGASVFAARDAADDIMDGDFRPWLEECDAPQGVQIVTGLSSAWSGFAARYADALRDELPKISLWAWAIDADASHIALPLQRRREAAANRAQAVASLSASASVLIPLSLPETLPPGVRTGHSLWERSAFLEAAIESVTLATRLRAGEAARVPLIGDWEAVLGDGGRRRVARLRMGVGEVESGEREEGDVRLRGTRTAAGEDADPDSVQDALDASLTVDFFPHRASGGARTLGRKDRAFARVETFRTSSENRRRDLMAAFGQQRGRAGGPVVECFTTHPPLPQPVTFPQLFAEYNSSEAVAVHASLSTGSNIATWLRGIAAPFGPASSSMALPGDIGGEEKESLRSALLEAADAYVEDWESASDSDGEDE